MNREKFFPKATQSTQGTERGDMAGLGMVTSRTCQRLDGGTAPDSSFPALPRAPLLVGQCRAADRTNSCGCEGPLELAPSRLWFVAASTGPRAEGVSPERSHPGQTRRLPGQPLFPRCCVVRASAERRWGGIRCASSARGWWHRSCPCTPKSITLPRGRALPAKCVPAAEGNVP